jgi:hypothetical protein
MFALLKSPVLTYSIQADLIVKVDCNNEDAIDKLLKVRDNVPIHRDKNSIIYAVSSQLNPKKWGGETLMYTYNAFNLLNNYNLRDYLEQFGVYDYNGRGAYNVDNRLYIEKGGLCSLAT